MSLNLYIPKLKCLCTLPQPLCIIPMSGILSQTHLGWFPINKPGLGRLEVDGWLTPTLDGLPVAVQQVFTFSHSFHRQCTINYSKFLVDHLNTDE